jgi:hypothetical protein
VLNTLATQLTPRGGETAIANISARDVNVPGAIALEDSRPPENAQPHRDMRAI